MSPAGREPSLSITGPDGNARVEALRGAFGVGRGPTNELVLSDTRVSRAHALIRPFSRKSWFLVDLGSANGTFLNGRLVSVPVKLNDGDLIEIGNYSLRFSFPGPAGVEETDPLVTTPVISTESVSVLVVDIRGFTRLAEALPAHELSAFVGTWFKDVSAMIESHGGVIDNYIGDAVLAYWRAGKEGPRALARGPLASAFDIIVSAGLFHAQLSARHPGYAFAVGCGIHMGEAAFGGAGTARRDMTPMGDCVNVAFRLESLAKELARSVIVSEEIRAAAGDEFEFQDLGLQSLKGKAEKRRVYAATPKKRALDKK